jgi:hypothetical protein
MDDSWVRGNTFRFTYVSTFITYATLNLIQFCWILKEIFFFAFFTRSMIQKRVCSSVNILNYNFIFSIYFSYQSSVYIHKRFCVCHTLLECLQEFSMPLTNDTVLTFSSSLWQISLTAYTKGLGVKREGSMRCESGILSIPLMLKYMKQLTKTKTFRIFFGFFVSICWVKSMIGNLWNSSGILYTCD